jgi:hypothetical protein
MSVINFMLFCNGVMFFHKSVDATGKSQDANYLYKVISLSFYGWLNAILCASYCCNLDDACRKSWTWSPKLVQSMWSRLSLIMVRTTKRHDVW